MLPEGISIWNGKLSQEDHPHQNMWASLNPLRAWIEQKGKGRANLFFVWTGVTVSSCPQTMILIGSWDLKSASLTPLAFLGLLLAENSSGDFYISIYHLLVLFLWRTLTNTDAEVAEKVSLTWLSREEKSKEAELILWEGISQFNQKKKKQKPL